MNNQTNQPNQTNVIPEPNAVHRVTQVANNSLPEGWHKEQMTNHPSVVWYEKNKGGEQWYVPGAEENDPTLFINDESLPTGWRKAYHRNNNMDPKLVWYVSQIIKHLGCDPLFLSLQEQSIKKNPIFLPISKVN